MIDMAACQALSWHRKLGNTQDTQDSCGVFAQGSALSESVNHRPLLSRPLPSPVLRFFSVEDTDRSAARRLAMGRAVENMGCQAGRFGAREAREEGDERGFNQVSGMSPIFSLEKSCQVNLHVTH